MFGALHASDGSADALIGVAAEFSPRYEITGPCDVVVDLSGLARLFGSAHAIAIELQRTAAERDLRIRVAIAGTATAARLLAHGALAEITVVEPGGDAGALAPLPLELLSTLAAPTRSEGGPGTATDELAAFRKWGLRTLGEIAALPADAVAARLGQAGVNCQRLARGEDPRPLLPAVPEERFEQALDLEWPIEGLEPLSFVLGRLIEPLAAHLDRRGRGAAVLHVRLHLVTRAVHERALQLPAPMKDARTLRTLALLDLESHPPAAAIDRVIVAVDPTPARVLQFSLLTRPLPSPEQISTLMARLSALMGEGRCGSPVEVDSWQPGAFAMKPFSPGSGIGDPGSARSRSSQSVRSPIPHPQSPTMALRRFRIPVPVRVRVEQGRPVRVVIDRRGFGGGGVTRCAGPWRTAGNWWSDGIWDRDEWDVTLGDGATYRVFRDRGSDAWFLDGVMD
jgi:protein ImuB